MGSDKKRKRASEDEAGLKKSHKKKGSDQSTTKSAINFLAAKSKTLDPTLSSLFASSPAITQPRKTADVAPVRKSKKVPQQEEDDLVDGDAELSEIEDDEDEGAKDDTIEAAVVEEDVTNEDKSTRKRKRKDKHDDLETEYMSRLAKSRQKEDEQRRKDKAALTAGAETKDSADAIEEDGAESDDEIASGDEDVSDEEMTSPPPQHESLKPEEDEDMLRAQRTVFVANVSTEAIKSKTARKTLMTHMSSFFESMAKPKDKEPAHSIESIRFRSTPFATSIPKKAAFAKKELMDATSKSTNAYIVYSSNAACREAARKLNGSIVLDRHIRVDEVAHPAKIDHRRCVFVGNLGFVDDESNIDKANEAEGFRTNHGNKKPADVEEGLWRTFGKCGTVESVRVVRDSKTRVGKGIAYVQFTDENGVEAALELNDKRFPPLLPRKLRVSRAKAVKRNARPNPESTRAAPFEKTRPKGSYVPKLTPEQQSQLGRANKLLGRAAAAQRKSQPGRMPRTNASGGAIRTPESFVFEGHRASSKNGKTGLKLGGKGKGKGKKTKPNNRSSKRAEAWKASGGKAAKE